jgi:hypothetical protein
VRFHVVPFLEIAQLIRNGGSAAMRRLPRERLDLPLMRRQSFTFARRSWIGCACSGTFRCHEISPEKRILNWNAPSGDSPDGTNIVCARASRFASRFSSSVATTTISAQHAERRLCSGDP